MSVVNILDSAGAYTLDSASALDLLTAGDRKVIVTDEVLRKLNVIPMLSSEPAF